METLEVDGVYGVSWLQLFSKSGLGDDFPKTDPVIFGAFWFFRRVLLLFAFVKLTEHQCTVSPTQLLSSWE